MLNPTLQYSTANGAMVSDEALMEAITDHRPEALNEFYSRHGGRLKSVIGNVVHEEGDADDVLQDILLQICTRPTIIRPRPASYLAGLSHSPAGVRSIGFAGSRLIVARKNVTRSISTNSRCRARTIIRSATTSRAPTCGIFCIVGSMRYRVISAKRSSWRSLPE